MAPETFTSSRHLPASDVYSLGMIIWEVLAISVAPKRLIATVGQPCLSCLRFAMQLIGCTTIYLAYSKLLALWWMICRG
jgi:energy-converting hydrogenase Eha subunit E